MGQSYSNATADGAGSRSVPRSRAPEWGVNPSPLRFVESLRNKCGQASPRDHVSRLTCCNASVTCMCAHRGRDHAARELTNARLRMARARRRRVSVRFAQARRRKCSSLKINGRMRGFFARIGLSTPSFPVFSFSVHTAPLPPFSGIRLRAYGYRMRFGNTCIPCPRTLVFRAHVAPGSMRPREIKIHG
jgi:hypothetical protein